MIRLGSYHINAQGIHIEHDRAAHEEGSGRRRFGFHWRDEFGWRELSLKQVEDVRYSGVLNYVDKEWDHPVHAEVSWSAGEQRWEIKVSSHYLDQPLVIFATKK